MPVWGSSGSGWLQPGSPVVAPGSSLPAGWDAARSSLPAGWDAAEVWHAAEARCHPPPCRRRQRRGQQAAPPPAHRRRLVRWRRPPFPPACLPASVPPAYMPACLVLRPAGRSQHSAHARTHMPPPAATIPSTQRTDAQLGARVCVPRHLALPRPPGRHAAAAGQSARAPPAAPPGAPLLPPAGCRCCCCCCCEPPLPLRRAAIHCASLRVAGPLSLAGGTRVALPCNPLHALSFRARRPSPAPPACWSCRRRWWGATRPRCSATTRPSRPAWTASTRSRWGRGRGERGRREGKGARAAGGGRVVPLVARQHMQLLPAPLPGTLLNAPALPASPPRLRRTM